MERNDNSQRLKYKIRRNPVWIMWINDVVPFRWDALYTFGPYESKEEIAEKIGFQSPDIKENYKA